MERGRWLKPIGWIVLAFVVAVLPALIPRYYQVVLIDVMQAIILGLGFRMVFSIGRFTLGNAAFVAMGAYTSALLATNLGLSFWLGLVAAGVVATIFALAIGAVILRVSGAYFVIITLAFAEALRYSLLWATGLTGGVTGVLNIPGPAIGSFEFGLTPLPYYYLIMGIAVVTVFVMYRMEHSRVGMTFQSLRQNHVLAEHLGVHVARYRILGFCTAAFFSGLVGSFQAHYMHYVSPDDFTLFVSLYYQVYAFVGGVLTVVGPILGATIIVGLSEYLRVAKEVQPMIFGLTLILVTLFLPRGVISLPGVIASSMRRRAARSMAAKAAEQENPELVKSAGSLG